MIVERGCAQQSYQHQALVRGKWRTVTTVLEEVSSSSNFPGPGPGPGSIIISLRCTPVAASQTGSGQAPCLQTQSIATARRTNVTARYRLSRCACGNRWKYTFNPQEGDLNAAVASNGTDFNSTFTTASSKSYSEPDSLPHPRNTLFYKISKSESPDMVPILWLLLSSYFLAKVLWQRGEKRIFRELIMGEKEKLGLNWTLANFLTQHLNTR